MTVFFAAADLAERISCGATPSAPTSIKPACRASTQTQMVGDLWTSSSAGRPPTWSCTRVEQRMAAELAEILQDARREGETEMSRDVIEALGWTIHFLWQGGDRLAAASSPRCLRARPAALRGVLHAGPRPDGRGPAVTLRGAPSAHVGGRWRR
jgi:hypothetical protein